MAHSFIQQNSVINTFERLLLSDASVEPGSIDPSSLTGVFPVDPAWLEPTQAAITNPAASINGGLVSMSDVGLTSSDGHVVTAGEQRVWNYVEVRLTGGTVSPIRVSIQSSTGGSLADYMNIHMTNPGRTIVGPFLMMPGWTHVVRNSTNGGAGDTMLVNRAGFISAPGVPLPFLYGPQEVIGSGI
jgi:hypothetical protein